MSLELCSKAEELLDDIPPFMRGDSFTRRVFHAMGREQMRLDAAIHAVQLSYHPSRAGTNTDEWDEAWNYHEAVNLITNPSFEVDTAGWDGSGGSANDHTNAGATLTRVTSESLEGVASLQVATSGANANQGVAFAITGTFKAGTEYTASAWVRVANAGGDNLDIVIGQGPTDRTVSSLGNVDGIWRRVAISWTPTADRSSVNMTIRTTGTQACTFHVERVMVTEGPLINYFDGDTDLHEWTGAAHASISRHILYSMPDFLAIWEWVLDLPVAPGVLTTEQRRDRVLDELRLVIQGGEGADWVATVDGIVGGPWRYEEHVPGDATSPDPYTIRIVIPYALGSVSAVYVQRAIREATPANMVIQVVYEEGFIFDESPLL
jgi:hypothetical protein